MAIHQFVVFSIFSTSDLSCGFLVHGPIKGVVVIRPSLIGLYLVALYFGEFLILDSAVNGRAMQGQMWEIDISRL